VLEPAECGEREPCESRADQREAEAADRGRDAGKAVSQIPAAVERPTIDRSGVSSSIAPAPARCDMLPESPAVRSYCRLQVTDALP
jgi:hypothetical protein